MRHTFSPKQVLRSIILSQLVIEGPLHGYALSATIEEKFGWKPSQTAIYNSLKDLEGDNVVSSEERVENGRAQKVYSITEKGQEFLADKKDQIFFTMSKRMSQIIAIMHDFSEIDCNEDETRHIFESQLESKGLRKRFDLIPVYYFKLFHIAPDETIEIMEEFIDAFENLAKKHNINIVKFKEKLKKLDHNSKK